MTQADQVQQDLQFVRRAIARQECGRRGPGAVYFVWAAYTLIGFTLIDFANRYSGIFFAVAWIPAAIASGVMSRQWVKRTGELDVIQQKRAMLHWMAGGLLAVATSAALSAISPKLTGLAPGQICLAMMGMVYFLAGVHMDRSFIWLGLLLLVGSVMVGLVPQPGAWTALGAILAVGLCAAGMIAQRASSQTMSDHPAIPN